MRSNNAWHHRRHDQLELPATGEDLAGLAQLKAKAPLRPSKPQQACDEGLFGDDARQTDLLNLTK
jgi:hypothetical protein